MKRFRRAISVILLLTLFVSCSFCVNASAVSVEPRFLLSVDGIYRNGPKWRGPYKTEADFIFVGDLMCLRGQQSAAKGTELTEFTGSFAKVAPIFKEADFVVGNLETLISKSNPTTYTQVNAANGSPQCNGPVSMLAAVRRAGFDAVVTANNHCCDWTVKGIDETLEMLDLFGFMHTGTWHSNEYEAAVGPYVADKSGRSYVIAEVCGIKTAIISTTHLINQRNLMTAEQLSAQVNCFDRERLKKDIADARSSGAEFVVVYAHWGIENTHEVCSYQKDDAVFIAEAGADLIIGSHPHCLQDGAFLATSDGREVPVLYSAGNFVSSMGRDINNDTIILKVKLVRDSRGNVSIDKMSYVPCYCIPGSYVVTPATEEACESSTTLKNARSRIEKVIRFVEAE